MVLPFEELSIYKIIYSDLFRSADKGGFQLGSSKLKSDRLALVDGRGRHPLQQGREVASYAFLNHELLHFELDCVEERALAANIEA